MPLDQRIMKTSQETVPVLVERAKQLPSFKTVVVAFGGKEPIEGMLNPYSLNLEQKNFLIERIGDLITKQCLMEAREVTPTPLIWQE